MPYTLPAWQDAPSPATPISAANLTQANTAINSIDSRLTTVETGKVSTGLVNAQGNLISANGAGTATALLVGGNGQVLTADSAAATGLKWSIPAAGSAGSFSVRALNTQVNSSTSGPQTVDGVACVAGDRVYYTGSTTPSFNGIYIVQSAGVAWTRAPEMVSGISVPNGSLLYVHEGTSFSEKTVQLNNTATSSTATIIGTDTLTFAVFPITSTWTQPTIDTTSGTGTGPGTPTEPIMQIFVANDAAYSHTLTANTNIGIVDGTSNKFFQVHFCLTQDATGGWYTKFPGSIHWSGIPIDGQGQPMLSTAPNSLTYLRLIWLGLNRGYVGMV